MLFTNNTHGIAFAKDPGVVRFKGRYILYHSTGTYDEAGKRLGLGVGIAESPDMENWTIVGEVPLTQPCEEKGIGAPSAIVLGGQVHLFYQTYGNWQKDAICHAVSDDGINFVKDPTNPIFRPSADWCVGRAIDADIIAFKGKLFLYFATRDHEMRVQKVGVASAPLGSSYSRDDWTQCVNQSILAPEMKWEQECIEAAATLIHNDKVFMFYGGAYNCKPQQIGCAVSSDGVFFTRVSAEPLLGPGPEGSWNSSESGHPYAFTDDDGQDYLFYQGSSDMGKTWYLSRARIHWDGDMPRVEPLPL